MNETTETKSDATHNEVIWKPNEQITQEFIQKHLGVFKRLADE